MFALCCLYTGYLLGFEVYLGKETDTEENSASKIVDRLINEADLVGAKGRILYTDNWYTSIRLGRYLYEKYRWLFVGTVVVSDSKVQQENSLQFCKLSSGIIKNIIRGWMRKATRTYRLHQGMYNLQCTTWKDKNK